MDYCERTETKIGVIFQIANQYMAARILLEDAKEQIKFEMANIRPAQFEAFKMELKKRLQKAGSQERLEKLSELFHGFFTPAYARLEPGHPLKNYYEENRVARTCLVKADELEFREAAAEAWAEIYEQLSRYEVHLNRQIKNFYPIMASAGMKLQTGRAGELSELLAHEIHINQERLKKGNLFDFILAQRSFLQVFMNYLDLEERVLFPHAAASLKNEELLKLKRLDDAEGYAYMETSAEYIPKKEERFHPDPDVLLPALLESRDMGIVLYTLQGEVVYSQGIHITEGDLYLPENVKQNLINKSAKKQKYWYNINDRAFLITYSLVTDQQRNYQGILKTKEEVREIEVINGNCIEKGLQKPADRYGGFHSENK